MMNQTSRGFGSLTQNLAELVGVLATFLISAIALSWATGNLTVAPFATAVAVALCSTLLKRRKERWRDLGLARPLNWGQLVLGTALLVAVILVFINIVQPPLEAQLGRVDLSELGTIEGNLRLLVYFLFVSWVLAGLGEEALFRGFVMRRLTQLFGSTGGAAWIAAAGQALIFGLLHFYQGPSGMIIAAGIGLIFGMAYLALDNLWPCVIAHGVISTLSFTDLYLGGTLL